MQCNVKQMDNFRRSLPDDTNRHALILTHSLSRFTLPRCALYSDNPGLWDIQLSSRDLCETTAKAMSLTRRPFSWLLSFIRSTRRPHRQQTSGHHAPVTNGDPAGFSCDQHRTCVHCTLSLRQANH